MSAYSSLELKYARPVASAILQDTNFRRWLLANTRYGESIIDVQPIVAGEQTKLRSKSLKNTYWFNYFCGKDSSCVCRFDKKSKSLETDILLILECANKRRLALHIEIKPPRERLRHGQAESYRLRASCWADPNTRSKQVPPHQEFLTILICGPELASDERTRCFDKMVFHDEVRRWLPIYPEA
jgi:hypothetical protein